VGYGTVSGQIVVGGRMDLSVQLAVLPTSRSLLHPQMAVSPTMPKAGINSPPEVAAAGSGVPFVQVAVGGQSTCAIRSDASLWCWGGNTYGQLLLPSTFNRLTPVGGSGRVLDSGGLRTEPLLRN
jgi:hypothetical protein